MYKRQGVPFYPISDAGLKIAAHFYKHNMVARKGDFSAVMFGKILTDEQLSLIHICRYPYRKRTHVVGMNILRRLSD